MRLVIFLIRSAAGKGDFVLLAIAQKQSIDKFSAVITI
jgi:hypothetical protein